MKLCSHKEVPDRLPATRIRRLFSLIVSEEADPYWTSEINLVTTTDCRMRALNRDYRDIDRTTDVLSFNIDPPSEPGGVFGEVYISAATVRRQAREYETSFSDEYLRLFCHGMLHLFGYDHSTGKEADAMERRQEHYLANLKGIDTK
ncbi:MAG: rRNA maturation RNase YbeY [Candidatus Zixiibacteriota bacterium]|nr:MAG: rRNA maturation RNase YbeY [candidate division Zixibacteria bacterium]